MINDKRGIELSFSIILAIIAGAVILFLAIYAAIRFIDSGNLQGQTVAAKELSIVFNPLEPGQETGKSTKAELSMNTRLYTDCSESGNFGSESFSLSQQTGMSKNWPKPGVPIKVNNKYIFSEDVEEGKTFYFFVKPFTMPFKVSGLIFLNAGTYCFNGAPEFIQQDLGQVENVKFGNCTGKDISVCFGSNCNVSVYGTCSAGYCTSQYDQGYVVKQGKTEYFTGNLMYAAIFSSPESYECNFKRLMLRIESVAELYSEETEFLSSRGCGDTAVTNLIRLSQAAQTASPSSPMSLNLLVDAASKVDEQNSVKGGCQIY